ncbi:phage terminase small subunit [Endozoicomonas ascidiicola]|uniref:phage terminase small subunit n=1 Tax=Endozoicomonas ascidiicola TaxID=1698521 RepID=UPI0012FC9A75|nr:phage terminase small subunit [Endozoicomonas ascidiicola]
MKQYQTRMKGKAQPAIPDKPKTPQKPVGCVIRENQNNALMHAAMEEDLKGLKDIRSVAHKIQLKREQLVPKYRSFVEATMNGSKTSPILSQFLVWLFDIGEISEATKLGEYCLKHNIPLPERFRRNLSIYIADEVLAWSERVWEEGHSPNPYFSNEFKRTVDDRNERPDELTAKYFRLAGLIAQSEGRFEDAVTCLEAAKERGAKVKTALNKCKSALKGQTEG